jgi:hypothetical protein
LLLGAFKHFLAHKRDRAQALKRGGAVRWVSAPRGRAEESDAATTAVDARTPDRVYDERWGAALLERVLGRWRHTSGCEPLDDLAVPQRFYRLGE